MNLCILENKINKYMLLACMLLFIVLIPVELKAHSTVGAHLSLPPSQMFHAHPMEGNDDFCTLYDATAISPRMSQVVVECIDMFLTMAAVKFFGAFYSSVGNIIAIVCTIAVIFFGFKVMFGLESMSSQSALFMLKMILVIFLTQDNGVMLEWRNDITQGTKDIGNFMSTNAGGIFATSAIEAVVGEQNSCASEPTIFARLDCTAVKLLGMDVAVSTGVTPNYSALAALIIGLFWSGGLGLAIAMMAIAYVFSLVMVMARIISIYITSMFAITLLMGLAPLFLPMILFEATKKMIQKWFLQILNYAIQPIVLFTFLIISLGVMNYSVKSLQALFVSGTTKMASSTDNTKILFEMPGIDAKPGTPIYEALIKKVVKDDDGVFTSVVKFVAGEVIEIAGKVFNYYFEGAKFVVNIWSAEFDEILNFFAHLITCLLMLMLMVTFLEHIPNMVSQMTAPAGEIMTATGKASLKAALGDRIDYTKNKASQAYSGAKTAAKAGGMLASFTASKLAKRK